MPGAIGVSSSFVGGDGRPLLEPGALFVDGNYALRLNAWCSVAGVTLALRSRFLRSADGELVDSGDQLIVTSNRLITTTDIQLGAGFPLNAEVFALVGTPTIGQCFVQVQIVRGRGTAAVPLATVLQGYVSATQALSWPGSPIVNSLDGRGALRTLATPTGGLGNDIGISVPTNARFELIAFRGQLVSSAVAGARAPSLVYTDLTQAFVRSPTNSAQPAGATFEYTWMPGFGALVSTPANQFCASLPVASPLSAGFGASTSTLGLLGGDQWVNIDALVREWLDI